MSPLKTHRLTLTYGFKDSKTTLTPLSIARALESMFPESNISVVPGRSNKLLTVLTACEKTHTTLLNLQEINSLPVKFETKNTEFCKGYFYCEDELDLTDQEQKQLRDQGVTDFYKNSHTDTYIVTFDRQHLPDSIKISSLLFYLKLFIPKPRRCFNCQRYGHTNEHCHHSQVCPTCSQTDHSYQDCKNNPKCFHCGGPHPVTSHSCPRFLLEQMVLEYKVTHLVDFSQARSHIYNSHPEIVSQIPWLQYSTSHKHDSIDCNNSTHMTNTETNIVENIVENLNKTIETQQSQISILISELNNLKSHLSNRPPVSEASQATQTLDENHAPMCPTLDNSESSSFFNDNTMHLYDVCENVIPQLPIHQSSPNVGTACNFDKPPSDNEDDSNSLSQYDLSYLVEEYEHNANLPNISKSSDDIKCDTDLSSLIEVELDNDSSDFQTVTYDRRGRLVKPPTFPKNNGSENPDLYDVCENVIPQLPIHHAPPKTTCYFENLPSDNKESSNSLPQHELSYLVEEDNIEESQPAKPKKSTSELLADIRAMQQETKQKLAEMNHHSAPCKADKLGHDEIIAHIKKLPVFVTFVLPIISRSFTPSKEDDMNLPHDCEVVTYSKYGRLVTEYCDPFWSDPTNLANANIRTFWSTERLRFPALYQILRYHMKKTPY